MTPLLLVACALDQQRSPSLDALADRGHKLMMLPELYHIEETSPLWDRLRASAHPLIVVTGIHARPAEWLLRRHRVGEHGLRVISLLDVVAPEEFVQRVEQALLALGAAASATPPFSLDLLPADRQYSRERWYPVHDKSRCIECGHCLQFCLFGVYEADEEGKVRVARPDNCKPGCPACARICPHSAIMFPLYHRDPAIAGAPGHFVELDAAGRKLYYGQTGARCPVCGQAGVGSPAGRGPGRCAECGRPVETAPESSAPARAGNARDELDALLDELEQLAGGHPD